jgi:nicotinamidase-related amidase
MTTLTSADTMPAGLGSVRGTVGGTTPYPWPYDADLSSDRLALVIVGWSREWWRRSQAPGVAAEAIAELIANVPLVFVVDHRPAFSSHLAATSRSGGPPIVPGAVTITCSGIDGFTGSPLDGMLRAAGRDHLLIAGCGLEAPVHSTLRSANDRGYECLLVVDACAPLERANVEPSVSMVNMSGGIFGAVGHTADVVAALSGPVDRSTQS